MVEAVRHVVGHLAGDALDGDALDGDALAGDALAGDALARDALDGSWLSLEVLLEMLSLKMLLWKSLSDGARVIHSDDHRLLVWFRCTIWGRKAKERINEQFVRRKIDER